MWSLYFAVDDAGSPAWTVPESECRIGSHLGSFDIFVQANSKLWGLVDILVPDSPGRSFICFCAVCLMASGMADSPLAAVNLAAESNERLSVAMELFLSQKYGLLAE